MRLRVLTLNVWALPAPFARDGEARMLAIGAALGALALDVAAFQEVWSEPERDILVDLGRRAGLGHVWHPAGTLGGSGLLVLSRVPILEARLHRFELAGVAERIDEADYLGGKGFADLVLDTGDGEIALVDTHLQAAYAPRDRDAYVGVRVGQALQLATHLRGIERPLILTGDMNCSDAQVEYQVLTDVAQVADVAAALERTEATVLASNPYRRDRDRPEERIDYVFCRSGRSLGLLPRSVERVLDAPLAIGGRTGAYSDHAGVLAQLELGGPGAELPPIGWEGPFEARRTLQDAREEVLARQRDQRALAALGFVAGTTGFLAAGRPTLSRRRFLQAGAVAAGSLSVAFGAGRLALTELFRPAEIEGFDAALARLDELTRPH